MGMGEEKNSKLKGWQKTTDPRIKRRYNGQLYARFTKSGLRIEQRLHETNMTAAKKAVDMIEDFLRDGKTVLDVKRHFNKSLKEMPKEAVLIGELWNEFSAYRTEGDPQKKLKPWRVKTQKEYSAFWVRSFEPFWANKLPTEITKKTWSEFIDRERKRSTKGASLTFENHLKYFRAFCSYLFANEVIEKKPTLWDPNWVAKESAADEDFGVVFTDSEIGKMLEHSTGGFGLFIRNCALMGMRSSETTQLLKDRIDLVKGVIRLRAIDVKTGSKTGRGRVVPIHPETMPLLKEQLTTSGDSPYLFPNRHDKSRPMSTTGFRKQWDALITDYGINPEGTPHHLRHTYATKAFSNPLLNPVLVCKALGMSMETAMRVYIHFKEEQLLTIANRFTYEVGGNL